MAELDAAKSLFNSKLENSLEEKFALESKLVLAKHDAIELAVQVEKLAEIAFQQATSHILEDAQLRIAAAETSAAEAAYQVEQQIKNTTEGTLLSIVNQSKDTINKALTVAEQASERAKNTAISLSDGINMIDEVSTLQSNNIKLQNAVSDLENELLLAKSEIDRLKLEVAQVTDRAKASEHRANAAEKALSEFQEITLKKYERMEEENKLFLEKLKKEAVKKEKAVNKAFKAELDAIMAAVESAKETARLKDEAYSRHASALQRSLNSSEAAAKVWKQRAEMAESLIQSEKDFEEVNYLVSGGRIDLLTDEDSIKWKLLTDGPRREIPDWMKRKIRSIHPKLPPRIVNISEALSENPLSLDLPTPEEVWSIAQEKPKEGDTLIEHVIEKEIIEKKRKSLERALQRKTIKWQRTPEETKLGLFNIN